MNSRFHWCAPREVGETTLGERAQQVQRRRRPGGSRAPSAAGRGAAPRRRNAKSFTMSPRYDGSSTPSRCLDRRRAGLGELARDPADLQRRYAGAVGEHDRHLEDDLELVADAVGREVGERLRAVAGVQQEAVAFGDARERAAQRARLAREHERRQRAELGERGRRARPASGQRAAARRGGAASSWAPSREFGE